MSFLLSLSLQQLDRLSMLAFHPVKMQGSYEKMEQLNLEGLQQRFDVSSPSVFISRAQILMREVRRLRSASFQGKLVLFPAIPASCACQSLCFHLLVKQGITTIEDETASLLSPAFGSKWTMPCTRLSSYSSKPWRLRAKTMSAIPSRNVRRGFSR